MDWLKKNFSWLYATAQANTSIGTAYIYGGDNEIPAWALLGEYDNGSSKGAGRTEYIWLPTEDGNATTIGLYRGGQFYALHTDHLGTPRLMTNEVNKPVWQWPYSAFGQNKPTGVLKATANPKAALTNRPVLLQATAAPEMNLGFPGQMRDVETGAFYNALRDAYDPSIGAYRQMDPIGLNGGPNRRGYVEGNPVIWTDPSGLNSVGETIGGVIGGWGGRLVGGTVGGTVGAASPVPGGMVLGSVLGGAIGKRAGSFLGGALGDMCTGSPRDPCDELKEKVRDAKDNIGEKYRGGQSVCQAGMSKWELRERADDWLRLAQARAQRDERCFGGGDLNHQVEQAAAWKQVSTCQNLMK